MKRRSHLIDKTESEIIGKIGFSKPVSVDLNTKRSVLIVGANSYIGEAFAAYAENHYGLNFEIATVDTLSKEWRETDFSKYDIVFHVAGIAHADIGNVSDEVKEKYYLVNTDLAIEVCEKAKAAGVKEFFFMSSMIVYGGYTGHKKDFVIDETTVPKPANFYGDSKLQADVAIRELADDSFKVIVLRPPMIYGKNSKGNYPLLEKIANRIPIFPRFENRRSMLYIGNLCEFLCKVMLSSFEEQQVVLFPQNGEWTNTSQLVKYIADAKGKKMGMIPGFSPMIKLMLKVPGKIGGLAQKAFGNFAYAKSLSEYEGLEYRCFSLKDSVTDVEKEPGDRILVISQYFYPEQFRVNDICQEWVRLGHKVTVLTGIPNYPQGYYYEGYSKQERREEVWEGIKIIRLPIRERKTGVVNLGLNYLSYVKEGNRWVRKTKSVFDKVFVYEVSPMTQALVGVKYAKKHHKPLYLYVTDLWPENVEAVLGIHNPIISGTIGIMVDYIYRHCKTIFCSSESFVEKIKKRGVPGKKLVFWPQYAESFYEKRERGDLLEIPNDDILNLTFAGNIGTAQGLDVVVDAAKQLKKEGIKVRFNFIGNGRYEEELKKKISDSKTDDYFKFISRKPADKIPDYFAWSDAALITLARNEVYAMTIPAKTQSCLACGIPVLVAADGEVQEIIRKAECGYVGDAEDGSMLAENVKRFLLLNEEKRKEMGRNALAYYVSHFEKNLLINSMEDYLNEHRNV